MSRDEKYMLRCLELASLGIGSVAPNPMVGCVIVHGNKIYGEGFHKKYGMAHAEVNAINTVIRDHSEELLKSSSLYVNLEPCSHFGKTPPCADLIIKHRIPKVIIACKDSNEKVSGQGIKKLKEAGCEVVMGVLENDARVLNKRFFIFHEKQRPYIILKWAQTLDGFIASEKNVEWISSEISKMLVHKWRSQEQSILVGTNTALRDNPKLNVREWIGNNPVRIAIDKNLTIPERHHLMDKSQETLIFTSSDIKAINPDYIQINFKKDIIPQMLKILFSRGIQSIFVEGGAKLLNSFLSSGLWDEARVFVSEKVFGEGIKAPGLPQQLHAKQNIGGDKLLTFLKPL